MMSSVVSTHLLFFHVYYPQRVLVQLNIFCERKLDDDTRSPLHDIIDDILRAPKPSTVIVHTQFFKRDGVSVLPDELQVKDVRCKLSIGTQSSHRGALSALVHAVKNCPN